VLWSEAEVKVEFFLVKKQQEENEEKQYEEQMPPRLRATDLLGLQVLEVRKHRRSPKNTAEELKLQEMTVSLSRSRTPIRPPLRSAGSRGAHPEALQGKS